MMDLAVSRSRKQPTFVSGFTLLEALIALSLLAIVVTMLARVHVQTLRAEVFSQRLDEARLQMESLVSYSLLGYDSCAMVEEARAAGWLVQADSVGDGQGATWQVLRVAASNDASPSVQIYLRP